MMVYFNRKTNKKSASVKTEADELGNFGATHRNRTCNLRITSALHYHCARVALAEGLGFEPREALTPRRFSRPVL